MPHKELCRGRRVKKPPQIPMEKTHVDVLVQYLVSATQFETHEVIGIDFIERRVIWRTVS